MTSEMLNEKAFSREREFIENLLNARANFGLVVFGLSVAAAVAAENRWLQVTILVVGGALAGVLASTTARSQWKLDLILETLPATHPAKYIDAIAKERAQRLGVVRKMLYGNSRRGLIGYVVPCILSGLLLVGALLVPFGVFDKHSNESRELTMRVDSLTKIVATLATKPAQVPAQTGATTVPRDPIVEGVQRTLDSLTRRVNDSVRKAGKKP